MTANMCHTVATDASFDVFLLPDLASDGYARANAESTNVSQTVNEATLTNSLCILSELVPGKNTRYTAQGDVVEAAKKPMLPLSHGSEPVDVDLSQSTKFTGSDTRRCSSIKEHKLYRRRMM